MNFINVSVGIAEDEQLTLKALGALINSFNGFKVVIDALNGKDFLSRLEAEKVKPEIVILDVNMPLMDGITTAAQISEMYPAIKIVALSMNDADVTIIKMLKAGCCAYLLKDIHPNEFERALNEINTKGYYNADAVNINYRRLLVHAHNKERNQLTERELAFLQLACSDLTYKKIASIMVLSERTIDGYREKVFEKLNVQSRVGMAMEAIRRKLISI